MRRLTRDWFLRVSVSFAIVILLLQRRACRSCLHGAHAFTKLMGRLERSYLKIFLVYSPRRLKGNMFINVVVLFVD